RLVAHHGCKKAPKLSREARQAITTRQRAKCADEDAAVDEVLTYIDEQATALAQRFGQSCRCYLEKIFIASALQRKWHNKTSAWSAYLHFKGQSSNEDKAVGQQSNIHSLAHDAEEYHKLTSEQCSEMVDKFNKIKNSGQSKPPNVTARTRLVEVNHSFAAMVSEAEALKERVGTETLIVAVQSSTNLNMLPKVHFTSDVVSHFIHTLLHEDPMKLGIKMESTVLAGLPTRNVFSMTYTDRKLAAKSSIRNGLNQSLVEVTEDQNTTLEFVCYEWMVQSHLIKIVGWCHDHWGNPSNLKGGIDALQTLALAIDNRTCRFVKISKDEAIKRLECIDAGEDLSPNKVDTEPYI
ncbi:hypothetical protein P692DRAFT_20688497, partial [Suillus brevipes Sb2]